LVQALLRLGLQTYHRQLLLALLVLLLAPLKTRPSHQTVHLQMLLLVYRCCCWRDHPEDQSLLLLTLELLLLLDLKNYHQSVDPLPAPLQLLQPHSLCYSTCSLLLLLLLQALPHLPQAVASKHWLLWPAPAAAGTAGKPGWVQGLTGT
jgi:hypothetical protein